MKKYILVLIMLISMITVCSGCGSASVDSLENLNSKDITIAVGPGTPTEQHLKENYPEAKTLYVESSDLVQALKTGRVDAAAYTKDTFDSIIAEGESQITYAVEAFGDPINIVIGYPKKSSVPNIKERVDECLNLFEAEGIMEDMRERWLIKNDFTMPEIKEAENPEFTLRVGTTGLAQPMTFTKGGQPTGFDIELAKRIAYELNAKLEINLYDWNGLFALVDSDREDILISYLYQSSADGTMEYSRPYLSTYSSIVVLNGEGERGLAYRIKRNFIEEDRWKTMVMGLGYTIMITMLAAIFGTILGSIMASLKLWGPKMVGCLITLLQRLVSGLPVIILLMYFYYVFFTKSSGLWVAVITFSLMFAVQSSIIIVAGINTIDVGQWEAAHALGFSKRRTIVEIVVPQALKAIIPPLCQAVIGMLLLTSVCGYVSIVDMTYAATMIRARTYDALVPLTLAGLIYLALSLGLSGLFSLLVKGLAKDRCKILDLMESSTMLERNKKAVYEQKVMVDISHLKKSYANETPIKDITTQIKSGDVISIIGPSGTGKSTFIRMINGLETPTAGTISLFGSSGMVFQSYNLFPHMSIAENIMFAPMKLKGVSRQEAFDSAMQLLRTVGLEEKAYNFPHELSGGQKQRAAIARTLAMTPEVLLLDEPTSALDPTMVGEVALVIKQLAKEGHTMLIVTHEMNLAKTIANRVFFLYEGGIYEEGTPQEIFDNPQKPKTKEFLRKESTISFEVESSSFDFVSFMNQIDMEGHRVYASEEIIRHTQIVFDELLMSLLLPQLGENIHFNCIIEYKKTQVNMTMCYNGDLYNPFENADEITKKLLDSFSKMEEHKTIIEDGYTNLLRLSVK